ncbi:MAG: hypothetical protein NC320_05440 [Clostridium sp.]|nr:hypothetical protein [Clostridium sp.]
MKHCKYCGKELHEFSSYCPYCMCKLIDTECVSEKKCNALNLKKLLIISIALIVVLFLCIVIAYTKKNTSYNVKSKENSVSSIDYSAYIGTWYSKEITEPDDIYTDGGSAVQIFSIDDRIAEISLSTVQSAPMNRVATTDKIYGEVNGNVIQFHFQNDGWMSSGDGTITLLNDTIYAEVIYTYKEPSALWSLDHANIFYLLDSDNSETLD